MSASHQSIFLVTASSKCQHQWHNLSVWGCGWLDDGCQVTGASSTSSDYVVNVVACPAMTSRHWHYNYSVITSNVTKHVRLEQSGPSVTGKTPTLQRENKFILSWQILQQVWHQLFYNFSCKFFFLRFVHISLLKVGRQKIQGVQKYRAADKHDQAVVLIESRASPDLQTHVHTRTHAYTHVQYSPPPPYTHTHSNIHTTDHTLHQRHLSAISRWINERNFARGSVQAFPFVSHRCGPQSSHPRLALSK